MYVVQFSHGFDWADSHIAPFSAAEAAQAAIETRAKQLGFPETNYRVVERGATTAPAPTHYATLSPEPIDVIEAWELDYPLGSALKYLARAGRKKGNTAEADLEKAITFIRRKINALGGKAAW